MLSDSLKVSERKDSLLPDQKSEGIRDKAPLPALFPIPLLLANHAVSAIVQVSVKFFYLFNN